MSFWVTETVDSELLKAAHWAGGAASAAIDATRSLQQPEFSVSSKDDKQLQQLKYVNLGSWCIAVGFLLYVGISCNDNNDIDISHSKL